MAARDARSSRVHVHAQGGPVPGGSLRVYASRPCGSSPARGHAHRLRVCYPHRRRPYMRRSKVNGRIVPLKSPIKNGDVVEILTQTGHLPSKDWLAVVKTSRARNKIKHVINANERERAIDIGQKYLEKEARRLGVTMSRIARVDLESVASEYGFSKIEDLHAALGYGRYSARQVLHKLAPDQVPEKEAAATAAESAKPVVDPTVDGKGAKEGDLVLRVKGMDDLM